MEKGTASLSGAGNDLVEGGVDLGGTNTDSRRESQEAARAAQQRACRSPAVHRSIKRGQVDAGTAGLSSTGVEGDIHRLTDSIDQRSIKGKKIRKKMIVRRVARSEKNNR